MYPHTNSRRARCVAAFAGRASVLVLALLSAGCASNGANRQQAAQTTYPQFVYPGAQPAPPQQKAPQVARVEIEADGLPSQSPPPVTTRREADDPTEPFSPNYGSVPAKRQAAGEPVAADAPAALGAAVSPATKAPVEAKISVIAVPTRVASLSFGGASEHTGK